MIAFLLIVTSSSAILVILIIEIYYKLRKENQILSPYIHINSILLSVVVGICGIIIFFIKTTKSSDAEAILAPFILGPVILLACGIAGILVGILYRLRNYKLLCGNKDK